jgi:hypothetical protein
MKQWRFGAVMVVCLWNISNLMGQNIPKCSEIFFSEYVEGSRNNKALEIYNPTNKTVNLTQYRIVRWPNGSSQFSFALSHKLVGFLPSRKTIVLVIDKQDITKVGLDTPVVRVLAQKATLFLGKTDSLNFSMSFNGDDALSLEKYNAQLGKYVAVDIFGKIGDKPNPCWTDKYPYLGQGNWYSMDRTLIRKSWITHGLDSVDNGILMAINPTSYFNPTSEWVFYPKDMFDSLGYHHCNCENAGLSDIKNLELQFYPNPTNDKVVVNLEPTAVKKVYLISLLGEVIPLELNSPFEIQNGTLEIDLGHIKPGIYACWVNLLDGRALVGKIVKD